MTEYHDQDFIYHDPFNSACPCQKCSNEFFWGHWDYDRALPEDVRMRCGPACANSRLGGK